MVVGSIVGMGNIIYLQDFKFMKNGKIREEAVRVHSIVESLKLSRIIRLCLR
jgi:hypothetical protein